MMTNEKPALSAARAIASTLVSRYIYRISFIFLIICVVILIASLVLGFAHNGWWLLLAFLIFFPLTLAVIICLLTWWIKNSLRPRLLTKSETSKINKFVDEFGIKYAAARGLKKSPLALSGIVAWKYLRGGGKTKVSEILMEPIKDAKHLRQQFSEITQFFQKSQ